MASYFLISISLWLGGSGDSSCGALRPSLKSDLAVRYIILAVLAAQKGFWRVVGWWVL